MKPLARLVNPLLGAASLLLALFGLEGGSRLWEARHPAPRVAAYLWDWERMWSSEFDTVGLARGWPPTAEYNLDGLRDHAHPREKAPRSYRVVFLGDSVTMGHGIAAREAYPQVLQRRLDAEGRRIEVFNVALQGWSTRQEHIAYTRIARGYSPDLVVLAVCLNDIAELHNNLTRPPAWLLALHRRSALVRLSVNAHGREIRDVEELFRDAGSARVRQAWERFFEEARALRADVLADGAAFALIVFPFRFQVAEGAPAPLAQETILDACRKDSVRALDLLPRLRTAGASAFVDYDHLSPAGAELVADELMASHWLPSGYSRAELLAPLLEGRGATALVGALASPDPALREAAAWELGRRGRAARPAAPALLRALAKDPDAAVRGSASRALGLIKASDSVPALFGALADPSEPVRWAAAEALARLHPAGDAALQGFREALTSSDSHVRGFAAWSLGRLGPSAARAVPDLLALLERDEGNSALAARALAALGPQARPAIAPLAALLRGERASARAAAAQALGRLGPSAALALPDLTGALADPHPRVRGEAARALGRIGRVEPAVMAGLTGALGDEHEHVQVLAARALGWLGPGAAAAIPALERQARTGGERAGGEARSALQLIRPGWNEPEG